MSQQKKICLLGFSADAEKTIKGIIAEQGGSASFTWVSANDKELDGVVINASFLEAPQIQKYMGLVNKPIVCAHATAEAEQLAHNRQLHTISLSGMRSNVAVWMQALLGEKIVPVATASVSSKTSATPVTISPASVNASKNTNGTLLKKIRQGHAVVLRATHQENITWVKPAEGIVFINYPRETVAGYDQWLWEEVSESDIPETVRQLKIDLWLFETIWQSNLDSTRYLNKNDFYRLVRWPQPLSRQGRTEALRLAAIAQSGAVNLSILQEKTGYPADRISRFLFATLYAGQIEVLSNYIEQPRETVIISATEQKQREEKRSLLQRFRAKLGL